VGRILAKFDTKTSKVVTAFTVSDKPIAAKAAFLSKEAADETVTATVIVTSRGTGVGAGVGGTGVGASERGVTSNSSVSLVSFMPISSINLTLLSFVTLCR